MVDETAKAAPVLTCAECGRCDDGRRGWTMRLATDDELATFCPECDEREFRQD